MSHWSEVHRRKEAKATEEFIQKLENELEQMVKNNKLPSKSYSKLKKIISEFKEK